jgi:hypothetical protein
MPKCHKINGVKYLAVTGTGRFEGYESLGVFTLILADADPFEDSFFLTFVSYDSNGNWNAAAIGAVGPSVEATINKCPGSWLQGKSNTIPAGAMNPLNKSFYAKRIAFNTDSGRMEETDISNLFIK